jgi:glycerol-3-phosphate O-acyltransferase
VAAPVLPDEPPLDPTRPLVVLVDAASRLEQDILVGWAERVGGGGVETIDLLPSRRPNRLRRRRTDPRLAARLQRGDDPLVVPVRLAWFPPERHGMRTASWVDLLKLGDPRDPNAVRQHLIVRLHADRVRIVVGQGARADELLEAWRTSPEAVSLVTFVTRRAHLALERAERALRGNRYKVPRFVREEILDRAEFRDGVVRIAGEQGMPPELAFARARYYLREIAASHSTFVIDLVATAIQWLYRLGYGAILYDPDELRKVTALGESHPLAFLPSHRSMMDRLSLQYVLWQNDLPPNHTAAGINMNFWPVGPLIRRTGAFFIRRSFKDNPLYKFVLRSYLDYLLEKRFPLEWYMEGGRSRTGKLLPPRFGLLSWVVDSVRRGKADDLYLIPTAITYDQIQDVHDYAHEALGGEKRPESFAWAVSAIRSLRIGYGNIHIRFAEPVSVGRDVAELSGEGDEVTLDLQKLAFEVMYRISEVTPITPTSLVTAATLADPEPTVSRVTARCTELCRYVDEMGFPVTEPLELHRPERVASLLAQLARHGTVTLEDQHVRLSRRQAIEASYYRNSVVHHFVPGAITELALAGSGDPFDEALAIRDLLKFEFFFPAKARFLERIRVELERIDPHWEDLVATDRRKLLESCRPLRAHWTLLPFLEAYLVVAEQLAVDGPADEREFLAACLERGRRAIDEGRLRSPEAVSKPLFQTVLRLVENRRLDTPESRQAFLEEVQDLVGRSRRIAELENVSV